VTVEHRIPRHNDGPLYHYTVSSDTRRKNSHSVRSCHCPYDNTISEISGSRNGPKCIANLLCSECICGHAPIFFFFFSDYRLPFQESEGQYSHPHAMLQIRMTGAKPPLSDDAFVDWTGAVFLLLLLLLLRYRRSFTVCSLSAAPSIRSGSKPGDTTLVLPRTG